MDVSIQSGSEHAGRRLTDDQVEKLADLSLEAKGLACHCVLGTRRGES